MHLGHNLGCDIISRCLCSLIIDTTWPTKSTGGEGGGWARAGRGRGERGLFFVLYCTDVL